MSSPERNPNPEEPRNSETPNSRSEKWRSAALRADHQVRSAVDQLRPAARRVNERIVALILWIKQSLTTLFRRTGESSTDASSTSRLSGLAPSENNERMRSRHALRTGQHRTPSRLRAMQAGMVLAAVGVVGVVIGSVSMPQSDSDVQDAAYTEARGSIDHQKAPAGNSPQGSDNSNRNNNADKPKHNADSPAAIGNPRPEARTGDQRAGALSQGNQQSQSPAVKAQAGMDIPDNADGIDVSNHNGSVDWGQVAASGQKFAFVLASDGDSFTSSTFNEQYQGAKDAGMMAGAYHFGRPSSDATGQADRLLQTTGGYQKDGKTLPPVLDLEVDPNTGGCYGKSSAGMHEWTQEFTSHIKSQTGKDPIIYASPSFWQNCMGDSGAFSNNPLWLASYDVDDPEVPGGWKDYTFWQNSETGSVDGVSGPVDTNKFQGTGEDLKRLAR